MLIEGPASRQARSRPDVCGVSACGPGGPDGSQQGHRASPDSPRAGATAACAQPRRSVAVATPWWCLSIQSIINGLLKTGSHLMSGIEQLSNDY